MPHSSRSVTLVLCLLGACAGAPEIKRAFAVSPADQVEVALQSTTGKVLILRNPAASVRAAGAGNDRPGTIAKELDDVGVQKLLDALATYDYFRLAGMPQRDSAKSHLSVDVNGKHYRVGGVLASKEDVDGWTCCLAIFQDVFNRTGSYTVDTSAKVGRELQDEIDRQSRDIEAELAKKKNEAGKK